MKMRSRFDSWIYQLNRSGEVVPLLLKDVSLLFLTQKKAAQSLFLCLWQCNLLLEV